jgi:hypothetical protein
LAWFVLDAVAAQAKPDHATIARFFERHEQALAATESTTAIARGPPAIASVLSSRSADGRLGAPRPTGSTRSARRA